MSQTVEDEGQAIEALAAEYARAVRVWLPTGLPAEYEQFVYDGASRGTLVKFGGLVEQAVTRGSLPQHKQDANDVIRKIERLDPSIRSLVDQAALVILLDKDEH